LINLLFFVGSLVCVCSGQWTKIQGNGEQRMSHSITLANSSNGELVAIMFGGFNQNGESDMPTDLWQYNFEKSNWTQLIPDGETNSPPGRWSASLITYENTVILFGGLDDSHYAMNDLWEYDIASNTWKIIFENGTDQGPSIRYDHVAVSNILGMIIFGGASQYNDNSPQFNDLWFYIVESKEWKQIQEDFVGNNDVPLPREAMEAVPVNGNQDMLLAHGWNLNLDIPLNDMWLFQTSTMSWTRLQKFWGDFHATPLPRYYFGFVPTGDTSALLFGGVVMADYTTFNFQPTNEVWEYQLNYDTNPVTGSWTQLFPNSTGNNYPLPRESMVSAYVNSEDTLFVFQGFDYATGAILSDCWTFST